ncbi:hypothetical protein PAMA_007164 [Pampus argenteus]
MEGGRRSVNLGHPAAEVFQLMRERERERERGGMKVQFDHSSLATSATATERREREKEENPHHRIKDSSSSNKQQGSLSPYTPCSISPEHSSDLLVLHTIILRVRVRWIQVDGAGACDLHRSLRPATCAAACDLQPATCSLRPATCTAACTAACDLHPAACDLQPATCTAACNLHRSLQPAPQPATCTVDEADVTFLGVSVAVP